MAVTDAVVTTKVAGGSGPRAANGGPGAAPAIKKINKRYLL